LGWSFNPFTGNFDNTGPTTTPAGSNTYVQYNDSGVFGGDANYTWNKTTKLLTLTQSSLASTPSASITLNNSTAATGTVSQASPSLVWSGKAYKTNSNTSVTASFRIYNQPNISIAPRAETYFQASIDGSAWTNIALMKAGTNNVSGPNTENLVEWDAKHLIRHSNSTTGTPGGYTDTIALESASGQWINQSTKFGSNYVHGKSYSSSGTLIYSNGNAGAFQWQIGASILTSTLIAEISTTAFYCNVKGLFGGKVTAGSTDTSSYSTLSVYGSQANKGRYIDETTATLGDETFVLLDPTNAEVCTGTPSACSTYSSEVACNSHTGVGCSWFAGTSCSTYNGDVSTCSGTPGCTASQSTCSGANNTNSTVCTDQNNAYGGSCSYDTSTCPGISVEATCNSTTGCGWNYSDCSTANGGTESACTSLGGTCSYTPGDCSAFSGTDSVTCTNARTTCYWTPGDCSAFSGGSESYCTSGHAGCSYTPGDCSVFSDESSCTGAGCSWDGSACSGTYEAGSTCSGTYDSGGVCSGTYYEGSTCTGQYNTSCTGEICTGTYYDGGCNGIYGAQCNGSASCASLLTSGSCGAEAGCTWVSQQTITLPTITSTNSSNTSRWYAITRVGTSGSSVINAAVSDGFFHYGNSITLPKPGDRLIIHNNLRTGSCSAISNQVSCDAQNPSCIWTNNCSGISEEACPGTSGCSWNGSDCVGNYSCVGSTYPITRLWYVYSLNMGLNIVSKTANYTTTIIDDVVNCTSGTFSVTLMSAVVAYNKKFIVKNLGTGVITITTTSSQTVDGLSSGTITLSQGESITVVSDGSNWITI